ncbi:hypothetical protein ASPACDRAFT_47342 [Aspergillus aculeatus ATCC 16872]|uniref:Uncharacterized protein n=1 Tax=Aspergillus aculeatus (strain ATCC 16872 / CBS 172.66 / WB 5094) TaxID=690307 RepID=A0A1L9WIK3_ASPA1|nr:uncharacterized protein ASPACDRAFT_47342 [Aspergillus aculeatus ATCC 16872]OJJ95983.1 hypothetical protein ASPACDRAFT_47342 [Aspergillus aculeatus ATCC 16872]
MSSKKLRTDREEEFIELENRGRIIFVAIGLGGAIAKRILLDSRESVTHQIWEKCDGIITLHPTTSSYRLRPGVRLPYDKNLLNEAQVINDEFQVISSMVNTAEIRNTPRRLFQSPAESSQEHEGPFETNTYEAFSQSSDWYRELHESDDLFKFMIDKMITWLRWGQNISADPQSNTQAEARIRILSIDGGGEQQIASLRSLARSAGRDVGPLSPRAVDDLNASLWHGVIANCALENQDNNPTGGCSIINLKYSDGVSTYCCGTPVANNDSQVVCPDNASSFEVPTGHAMVGYAMLANVSTLDATAKTTTSCSSNETSTLVNSTASCTKGASCHDAAIGAGVGVPLGVIALASIVWALFERRRATARRAGLSAPNTSQSAQIYTQQLLVPSSQHFGGHFGGPPTELDGSKRPSELETP